MKIVVINGQTHKGCSYRLGHKFTEMISEKCDAEITEFFLPKDLNGFCKGCYACLSDTSKCYMAKEKSIISEAMKNADVLVFTTPNYCMSCSAPMKAFLDFFFDIWQVHRPESWAYKKRAFIFSTSAGAKNKPTLNTVKSSVGGWGVPYIKTFGIAMHANSYEKASDNKKAKIEKKLRRMANKLCEEINKGKPPKAGLNIKGFFYICRLMHKKGWDSAPEEKVYWQEKGWLDKVRPWKDVETK